MRYSIQRFRNRASRWISFLSRLCNYDTQEAIRMASTPPDPEDAIYEAAESEKIGPKPNFWMLKSFLKVRGVDTELFTKDEWLKKYGQARAYLQEIKDYAEQVGRSQDKPGQSAGEKVSEWPKKINPPSRKYDAEVDSAYQSEGSTDQVRCALRDPRSPSCVDIAP